MSGVALLTGASSGIGWESARLLARRGWRLGLAARREDRLQHLAELIQQDGGPAPRVFPTDVTRPEAVRRAVEATAQAFGRLDVLINNAGVLRMAFFKDMPVEEMHSVFDTNYWSVVHAVKAALPIFEKQGGGHVVNVGSGVSRRGLPFMAAYAASKFALLGLTESLRLETAAQGVTFSLVLPGGTDTEMPQMLDRSRLPVGYPQRAGYRVSAARAARAVVKAVESKNLEIHVPWWVRPGTWVSSLFPAWADRLIKKSYRSVQWK